MSFDQMPPGNVSSWGGDLLGQVGAVVAGGLNRWLDVEAYNRTGGALLPGGQVQPGGTPAVIATTTQAGAMQGMLPLLLLAGVAALLLLRK